MRRPVLPGYGLLPQFADRLRSPAVQVPHPPHVAEREHSAVERQAGSECSVIDLIRAPSEIQNGEQITRRELAPKRGGLSETLKVVVPQKRRNRISRPRERDNVGRAHLRGCPSNHAGGG